MDSPVDELRHLLFFTGTWEGTGAFEATELTPPFSQPVIRVEGSIRLGGQWLEQRFAWIEQPDSGGPRMAEALRLWGYSPGRRLFVSEWFDSMGRRGTVTSPGWRGDELVADTTISHAGRQIRAREIFTRHGDSSWRHAAEMDFGRGWVPTDEQVFHKL
ncbi:DUF1579 domain-containing protein [Nonomuraea sp. FMUSA5-5]|uniref:DUF1579 domain-containing protein n=1 Tax=Nonomuraea composti TaxID=2720023 RepID=A0ABX1BPK2_9ACTN|nr:DUF1579 family protein [Nonomuraea sp. FMUSA5-5]NJP97711.1 DUF1579 domain-containing protein [Nonomuraea sp. FMUSA5-5]